MPVDVQQLQILEHLCWQAQRCVPLLLCRFKANFDALNMPFTRNSFFCCVLGCACLFIVHSFSRLLSSTIWANLKMRKQMICVCPIKKEICVCAALFIMDFLHDLLLEIVFHITLNRKSDLYFTGFLLLFCVAAYIVG